MTIRGVVLDFDGTFTDVDAEGRPFVAAYRRFVDDLTGRDLTTLWDAEEAEVAAHPTRYGWLYEGKVVAPGNADPYIRTTTTAQRVFDTLGILKDGAHRFAMMQLLYKEAYAHTHAVFKPEAREVLDAITATGLPVYVVTNATPEVVKDKIDALGLAQRDRVSIHGDAKKYVICGLGEPDARFDALPETMAVDGLTERRVYLKRGKYYRALRDIWTQLGVQPSELILAGDIWELDLSLPAALGFRVQLVSRPDTPPHERAAVAALGERGGVSDSLQAVIDRVRAAR
jgi:FMN phosphatase YigB (HAD superfamily)